MKGKILNFNIQNGSGVISGDDGQRYNFVSSEWRSDKNPSANQLVDFKINEDNAIEIYLAASASGEKNKIAAALFAFFLGGLGIHKFYLGCTTAGVITLVIFFLGIILLFIPNIIMGIIALIEFVLYLTKSDEEFHRVYVENKKCWF
jgi:TM2 domain-containing membrane protein YozV